MTKTSETTMAHTCAEHGGFCKDIGEIKGLLVGLTDNVNKYLKKTDAHIDEADRTGGVRDRVSNLERTVKLMPWIAMGCGIFGAMIGKLSPVAFDILVRFIGAHFGVS
jgi:hypothetical protein